MEEKLLSLVSMAAGLEDEIRSSSSDIFSKDCKARLLKFVGRERLFLERIGASNLLRIENVNR
jgi:hypothetical protein